MKTAKLTVVAFETQCPHCLEVAEYPYTGSLMWLMRDGDIPTGIAAGQKIECDFCGEMFKLPKSVQGNKLPEVA